MKIYEVKNAFYLGGVLQSPGDIVELDDDRFTELHSKNVIGKEVVGTGEPTNDEIEGLIKLGGGYYQLPSGEKVRGKENALEMLKAGDPDAQTKTGESAASGTSDVK